MSKNAKLCILILVILLLVVFGFAGKTYIDKQRVEGDRIALEKQIGEYQDREKKHILDNKQLQDKLGEVEKNKTELEAKVNSFNGDLDQLQKKVKDLSEDRDNWKKRVDAMRGERDALLVKLQEKSSLELSAKPVDNAGMAPAGNNEIKTGEEKNAVAVVTETVSDPNDEGHWAKVLKQRTSLQLELDDLKKQLNASNVAVVELKKQNSDLQMEFGKLNDEKAAIEREIKYGNDLADSLSLELARAQNDKKFLGDRVTKIVDENTKLRDEIKQLTSTKIALEKSIVRLQDDKKGIEKKLVQTEQVIQSRIDEIWQIKDSLDKTMKAPAQGVSNQVELPPIVVSPSTGDPVSTETGDDNELQVTPGFNGNVVSINDDNNFVIVDIGEDKGIKLGDSLSVYRGTEYIAGLEVIQVRQDIAAADIKTKVVKIQVGDNVR